MVIRYGNLLCLMYHQMTSYTHKEVLSLTWKKQIVCYHLKLIVQIHQDLKADYVWANLHQWNGFQLVSKHTELRKRN